MTPLVVRQVQVQIDGDGELDGTDGGQLAYVLVRIFQKLLTKVGEGLRERATGGSSSGIVRGFFGGTKPTHVDPGFASNRDGL